MDSPYLTEKHLSDCVYLLSTRGYCLIEEFLESAHCLLLKGKLIEALASYREFAGSKRSVLDRHQLHDLLCREFDFAKLIEDPRIQQLLEAFLGPYWIMYAFTSSSIPPNGTNYSARIHVDSPRWVAGYPFNMGVIWTLDEYTVDNGALEVLPGSHHNERAPDEELFSKNSVRITCPAGSAIVFDARLFHRTGENKSDQFRHALTMNACRPYMKQRMDWVRFVPERISSALSARGRRVLGFDTRLPENLDEFFVPDNERLYKAGQG